MSGIVQGLVASIGGGTAPVNTVAPTISGSATVGSTLTTTNGTWTGSPAPTYTYQWLRNGSTIGGATSSTYVTVNADIDTAITCRVTATNASGSANAISSNSITVTSAPINTVAPTISGSTPVGSTLTTTNGTWIGSVTITYTYQWLRAGVSIGGATSSTYVTVGADVGKSITCRVTGTNAFGSANATSSNSITPTSVYMGVTTSGATVTTSGNYKIAQFNATGTFTVDYVGSDPTEGSVVEYLVVAGGAGGGRAFGGGGGAGGFRTGTGLSVTAQAYTATVGGGGAGVAWPTDNAKGAAGTNSSFSTITADGGGGGGTSSNSVDGASGGSGGGGSASFTGTIGNGGAGSQGNAGGNAAQTLSYYAAGGGGGGAGSAGSNATATGGGATGGNGGNGTSSSITGSSVTYAGGGGGATQTSFGSSGSGGTGGGGAGGGGNTGTNGTANTGGGGGGAGTNSGAGSSGSGGSGIVVIKWRFQ